MGDRALHALRLNTEEEFRDARCDRNRVELALFVVIRSLAHLRGNRIAEVSDHEDHRALSLPLPVALINSVTTLFQGTPFSRAIDELQVSHR